VSPASRGTAAPRIVFVCTANQCRSPLAGAVLSSALAARGVAAEIETAGLAGAGQPATEATVAVAARRDLDLTNHRSGELSPGLLASADLILGMERLHVREAVVALPSTWPRAFTLKEFVRRAGAVGARPRDEPLVTWIARVHDGRERSDLLGASSVDDLADPTGGTVPEHEDTLEELEALLDQVVQLAWPGATLT
jgi:protein-tyrosine phosphatase